MISVICLFLSPITSIGSLFWIQMCDAHTRGPTKSISFDTQYWYHSLFNMMTDDPAHTRLSNIFRKHIEERKNNNDPFLLRLSHVFQSRCAMSANEYFTLYSDFFFAAVLFTKIPFVYIFNQNRPMRLNEFVVIALMLWKWDFNCMLNSFEKN